MNTSAACRRSREGLTEYLEGALSPARRRTLENHLLECEDCRALLTQIRSTVAASQQIAPESMPAGMKSVLLRALRERKEP